MILPVQAEMQILKLFLQITYNGDFKVWRLFKESLYYDYYLIIRPSKSEQYQQQSIKEQYYAMGAVWMNDWLHNIPLKQFFIASSLLYRQKQYKIKQTRNYHLSWLTGVWSTQMLKQTITG